MSKGSGWMQYVNVNDEEQEMINHLLINLESVINNGKTMALEDIVGGDGIVGVIQAYLSMLISNFEQSLARFRVYPRFVKKLRNGKIRMHSTTRISLTETGDITWTLVQPKGEAQRLVIESINTLTIPIYEESQRARTEIPRLDITMKEYLQSYEKIKTINKIYTKIKKEQGKQKAKAFFDDSDEFNEEVDQLFSFLEGSFKIVAYIAVMGLNVNGWKGVIMKKDNEYEIIFDRFKDLKALEQISDFNKMTEDEYLDLLKYKWNIRTKKSGLKVTITVDKSKERIVFGIKPMPKPKPKSKSKPKPKQKSKSKLIKGERTIKSTT